MILTRVQDVDIVKVMVVLFSTFTSEQIHATVVAVTRVEISSQERNGREVDRAPLVLFRIEHVSVAKFPQFIGTAKNKQFCAYDAGRMVSTWGRCVPVSFRATPFTVH